LSLRILVDEDSQSRLLVRQLREAGHAVLTVNEAGLGGEADPTVLDFGCEDHRAVLTANVRDFRCLHEHGVEHAGILAICHDDSPDNDMSRSDIVRSIGNLEASGVEIARGFHVLNAWQW